MIPKIDPESVHQDLQKLVRSVNTMIDEAEPEGDDVFVMAIVPFSQFANGCDADSAARIMQQHMVMQAAEALSGMIGRRIVSVGLTDCDPILSLRVELEPETL